MGRFLFQNFNMTKNNPITKILGIMLRISVFLSDINLIAQ
jgi:hypothetical protein